MAMTENGNIGYGERREGGLRLWVQADPPVCEACEQELKRETLGSVELEARVPNAGLHEVLICSRCAEGAKITGRPLDAVLSRHAL